MEFQMDDFTLSPKENRQLWEEARWYAASVIDGEVKASISFRPYGLYESQKYVMDVHIGRANGRDGNMGRKQQERARTLVPVLKEHVFQALRVAGWRVCGHVELMDIKELWHYVGPAIRESEKHLEHLARRVWHGSYPWHKNAKSAPYDPTLFGDIFVANHWYPLGEDLETALDPGKKLLWVRRQHKRGEQEEQRREASSQRVAIIGDQEARSRGDMPAFHRTRTTRAITFRCAWCTTEVTQERYPSPKPRYCSDTCEKEAGREKTRKRVQKFREQRSY